MELHLKIATENGDEDSSHCIINIIAQYLSVYFHDNGQH